MPITPLRRELRRQPQGRITPVRSSLADGLVVLQSAARFARGNGSPTGILALEETPYGQGFRGGAGKYFSATPQYAPASGGGFSLAFEVIIRTPPSSQQAYFSFGGNEVDGSPRLFVGCDASNKIKTYWNSAFRVSAAGALSANERVLLVFAHDGAVGNVYLNGVHLGSASAAFGTGNATFWYFGSGYQGQPDAVFLWQAQWSRGLRPEEAVKIGTNPAALFAARRRALARAAGGAITLNSLTMTPGTTTATAALSITR